MGTRSKVGWNCLCTKRGPVTGLDIEDALVALNEPKQHNRHERRKAKAIVRKAAKFIHANIPTQSRSVVEKQVVNIARMLRYAV